MRYLSAAVAIVGLLAAALPAAAEAPPRLLRVLGETAAPPQGVPGRFVIDGVIEAGDDPFKAEIEGWMASLDEHPEGGEIEGACVEARCALSMSFGNDKLSISADLAGPGEAGTGRVMVTDSEGRTVGEATVRFVTIRGPVAGLGELAPPDAIRSRELSDLMMWNGATPGFTNARDEPIDWLQRSAVEDWQAGAERPGAGLILVEDLALLRDRARAAKAAVGWTPISGAGWTAGYPAALLPLSETVGGERRFSSADGKVRLVIAIEPPMAEEAFDAFVDKVTEDRPGVDGRGYTRVNSDMEINWIEKGRLTAAAYHNREGGFARLEYSVPEGQEPGDPDLTVILPRSFQVDEVKAP